MGAFPLMLLVVAPVALLLVVAIGLAIVVALRSSSRRRRDDAGIPAGDPRDAAPRPTRSAPPIHPPKSDTRSARTTDH